jgi:hypothetical protein
MADLPFPLKVDKRADGILDRYSMVNCVQLVKLYALDPQPFEAIGTGTAQVLGSAIGDPAIGTGAQKPALGGYHHPSRIRMQRLGDESFADTRTVRIGSVDKDDALLHRPPQQRDRLALIPRGTPDPGTRDAHCAKANLPHWQMGDGWFS